MKNFKPIIYIIAFGALLSLSISVYNFLPKKKKEVTPVNTKENRAEFIGPKLSKPKEKPKEESIKEKTKRYREKYHTLEPQGGITQEELDNLNKTGSLDGNPNNSTSDMIGSASSFASRKNKESARKKYKERNTNNSNN